MNSVLADFFNLFPIVLGVVVLIFLLPLYIYFFSAFGVRRKLKPVCYISYQKNYFHEEFEFVCEYCGSTVSSKNEKCSKCASAFGKNKEYQSKKRAMYQKYLQYLKDQEEAIQKEVDNISSTMKAIQRYKLIRHKYYNFDIGEPPMYKPAIDYEFTCEYCDNRLRGKSTDENGCIHCGASYKENLELLVREEEDRVEKRHYDQYMELKDLEWEQNLKNERRDAIVDEKYKTPIKFMEKNGKYVAVGFLLLIIFISMGLAIFLNFR